MSEVEQILMSPRHADVKIDVIRGFGKKLSK